MWLFSDKNGYYLLQTQECEGQQDGDEGDEGGEGGGWSEGEDQEGEG